ncbi:hypothetical protein BDV40DRAFT_300956 [Aspergillus tamarii]|uniref:Aminoglycoside phosphotransferase domain-containing protein n=1 Tax=Aspergillus tamarii TaxID=41984 RepID=A0A5N6UTB6_ASPTM|nr:hypothetical protein BDV40DRAFT_300956 [Aspergillus tamarii]
MEAPLPECIDSEEKQRKLAEDLAMHHYNKRAISSELVPLQGTASVTLEVTMEGVTAVIIQFRTEPFDTKPYAMARQLLGDAVPSIEDIQDDKLSTENVFCVFMAKMPGRPWMEIEDCWKEDGFLRCATSLGQLLSCCFVPKDTGAIETYIIPKLKKILTMRTRSEVDVTGYFPLVEKLITASSRLRDLPGFFSHQDLNTLNIFTDETGKAIHFLTGEFVTVDDRDIRFAERPVYESMERAFWKTLLESAPQEVSKDLQGKKELVQLAVVIGTVLRVLGIYEVDGAETSELHIPSLNALPKLLRYRIPFVRGPEDTPFGDENGQVELKATLASI